jgi:hypothetical protein
MTRLWIPILACTLALACSTPRRGGQQAGNDVFDSPDETLFGTTGSPDSGEPTDTPAEVGNQDAGVDDVLVDTVEDVGPDTQKPPFASGVSGSVVIVEVKSSQLNSGAVNAHFTTSPAPAPNPVAEYGPCKVLYSAGNMNNAAVPGLDAGSVVVTGLNTPVTLNASSQGGGVVYSSGLAANQDSIFQAGTISVNAQGSEQMAPFQGQVATPSLVNLTQPSSGSSFDTQKSLAIQWNAGNGSAVNIDLFVVTIDGDPLAGNTISCTLAGDPGSYTIPSGAMNMLPGKGSLFSPDILVYAVSRVTSTQVTLQDSAGTVSIVAIRSAGDGGAIE